MMRWLSEFLVLPRWTLFGRLRCLRGRTANRALCQVSGVDDACVDRGLKLVCEAFLIPPAQRYCLRPDDTLRFLYLGGHKRRLGDDMEFEHLFLGLDAAIGRPLTEEEIRNIATVGDVVRFLKECG